MVKIDHVTLTDEAARFAAAQVTAGRFHSMDEALMAAVEALQHEEELEAAWLELARNRIAAGREYYAQGGVPETTSDEFMDGIERELGLIP